MVVAPYDWTVLYIGHRRGRTDTSNPGLGLIGTLMEVSVASAQSASGTHQPYRRWRSLPVRQAGDRLGSGHSVGQPRTGRATPVSPLPASSTRSINIDNKWTGTDCVGIAHDRWLVYGKAGVRWTHNDYTDNCKS